MRTASASRRSWRRSPASIARVSTRPGGDPGPRPRWPRAGDLGVMPVARRAGAGGERDRGIAVRSDSEDAPRLRPPPPPRDRAEQHQHPELPGSPGRVARCLRGVEDRDRPSPRPDSRSARARVRRASKLPVSSTSAVASSAASAGRSVARWMLARVESAIGRTMGSPPEPRARRRPRRPRPRRRAPAPRR